MKCSWTIATNMLMTLSFGMCLRLMECVLKWCPLHLIIVLQTCNAIMASNCAAIISCISLLWRHNGRDGVSNHQPHDCLLKRSFRPRSKKTSKLRVTGLCVGNSPLTGQWRGNVSIWWRHHLMLLCWVKLWLNSRCWLWNTRWPSGHTMQ